MGDTGPPRSGKQTAVPGGQPLWHGRFEGSPADALLAYTVSLPFDRVLAHDDIEGSRAHVAGLVEAGIYTADEAAEVSRALDRVESEMADGTFAFVAGDEDIHTAVERRVTELAGDLGARIHTGRSRNDQVSTDLRLWCRRELAAVSDRVLVLCRTLLDRADESGDAYLPGYTHLQQAQPVLLSHHLLAHGWALLRDVDRLTDCRRRLDVSPLGAGALAGSSLPIRPEVAADVLGFGSVFDNSLDAVGDRDFVAEALFVLALIGVHLSRMGEEIVLWSSQEFGFCRLDDAYATGSSMLPQKKNPDIAELARGKSGRLIGNLAGLLATLKGLPLAYNRDLQEDKEPLFDSVVQVSLGLEAMRGLYATLTFETARMARAADEPAAAATDLAEFLVRRGTPFRRAHAIVGDLVRRSLDGEGTLADLVTGHAGLGPEAASLVRPGVSVRQRSTHGGAGPDPVAVQIERFEAALDRLGDDGGAVRARPLPLRFYDRDPLEVAPELLNKLIAREGRVGRIVEVEAYLGAEDPASHAFRGLTPRTETMFGPPGRLYVYRSYGIHWCANVVCRPPGVAGAVLLRAVEPLRGLPAMRADRPRSRRDRDLGAGPGRMCSALGVDGGDDGVDLRKGPVRVLDDRVPPPAQPARGRRIGISRAVDRPWRFGVASSCSLSRPFGSEGG